MAPTTGFEDTGGAEWTDLNDEQVFLETIAAETAAVLTNAGASVQGNPLWRIDIGAGAQNTIMLTGLVHGNEPAGREGLLQWVRNIAYSADPGVLAYLSTRRIVVMPTINPDMHELQRFNSNDVDININLLALIDQPEAQAFHAVRNDCAANLVIDCHERLPGVGAPADNMQYLRPQLAVVHQGIKDLGDDLIGHLQTELNLAGISHGPYLVPGRESSREAMALNHALGFLLETNRDNTRLDRVGYWITTLGAVREWHDAHAGDLAAMAEASRDYQATTSDQYVLQTGHLVPWGSVPIPTEVVGYRVSGVEPWQAAEVYGVELTGSQIALGQPARAVIPILFDDESDDQLADGMRLTQLQPLPTFASVQEFADVVYGSHRPVFIARVLTEFQSGEDPAGEEIDILGGDVTYDATAEMFADVSVETSGLDERRRDRFPRRGSDLLAPYGNEIFVARGVDLGGVTLWSPLGYFRINTVEQPGGSGEPIRIVGQDRMCGIVDAKPIVPYWFRGSTTVQHMVTTLVTDVYPEAVVVFDDDSGKETLGSGILVEQSRHAALAELVESLGKVVYFDGAGVLRIEDAPDPDQVVWDIKAGHHGVLVEASRRISRDGMANGVVTRGEGAHEQVASGLAVDLGVNSPTSWLGSRFGRVPYFFTSPLLKTNAAAQNAAESILRRRIGMPYSVGFGAVANPALRPRDVIRITQRDGTREIHHVETLTIPLTADEALTGSTREKTAVRVGSLTSGVFVP